MADEYKMLNPKCKKSMYINYAISFAVMLVIFYAVFLLTDNKSPENLAAIEYALIIMTIVVLIYCLVAPPIFYKHYRYMVTNEKIDIRRGIIILRRILVPIERIHQVEITRGPINNAFGLANIEITTAGGKVVIEFLNRDEAEQIADTLNDFVRSMIKDRGSVLEQ